MNHVVHAGHTFIVSGTLDAGSTLTADGGSGSLAGGIVRVDGNVRSDGSIVMEGGAAGEPGSVAKVGPHGVLVNTGSVLLENGQYVYGGTPGGGATAKVAGFVENFGTLQVGDDSGGAGARLLVAAGAGVENVDILHVTGGRYEPNLLQTNPISGGTIVNAGTLYNFATLMADGGGGSYGALSLGAQIANEGTLENSGSLVLGGGSGASDYSFGPGAGATLVSTGTLFNGGGISIGAAGDSFYRGTTGASGGLLSNVGVATNTGQITVAGSVNYYYGNPPAGTFASSGQLDNMGTITAGGGGSPLYRGGGLGGQVQLGGVSTNEGMLMASGGAGSFNERSSMGGSIVVSGTLTSEGNIQVNGGQFGYAPSAYFSGYGGFGGQLVDSGVLTNAGLLLIEAGLVAGAGTGQGYGGTATVSGTLINAGLIFVQAGDGGSTGGVLDITATGTLMEAGGTIIGTGALTNDGTIALSGHASIAPGIGASAGHAGSLTIAANASVSLSGSIGGQVVRFLGSGATLSLGAAGHFDGTLAFGTGADTVDLLGVQATGAAFVGASLAVTLGDHLVMDLATADAAGTAPDVRVASDGHGGTLLQVGFAPGQDLGGGERLAGIAPEHAVSLG